MRVLTLISAFFGLTVSATAQDLSQICTQYAHETVALQAQNLERACGFTGPAWQGDHSRHFDWCMGAGDPDAGEQWTEWRRQQIAACRGTAGQTAAQQKEPHPLAVRIEALADAMVARLARKTDALQARRVPQQSVVLEYKPPDLGGMIASVQPPRLADDAFRERYRSVIDSARLDPRALHLPPRIDSILIAPSSDSIEPNSSLLITGGNFGNQSGRVYLRYFVGRETAGREFRAEESVPRSVELIPFNPTWGESWFSNVIMAKVGTTFDDIGLVADREGEIRVVLPDGATARYPVQVSGGYPRIRSVTSARGDQHIRPGESFTIVGSNFGAAQGEVTLFLYPDPPKVWQKLRGLDRYVYWTPHGYHSTAGMKGDTPVSIRSWSDTKIEMQAQPLQSPAYATNGFTGVKVTAADGKHAFSAYESLWFGPEQASKPVSGYSWLEREAQPNAKQTPEGSAMVVTHTPSCDFFGDEGESGVDWFFADAEWPHDVQVTAFDFKQIDPEDPYNDLDFFADQISDIVNALADGPLGVAAYVAEKILDAIFGSGTGGYHAYVSTPPGGHSWQTRGVRQIGIKWETDCSLGGKPVVYVVAFTITGTPEALAQY